MREAWSRRPRTVSWLVAACCCVAFATAGCSASSTDGGPIDDASAAPTQPASPPAQTQSSSPAAKPTPTKTIVPVARALTSYQGSYFNIDYPQAWQVETAEQSKGSYLDTTIRGTGDPNLLLRVDVTPSAGLPSPEDNAAPVVAALRAQSTYRELAYSSGNIDGYPSLRWEFLVEERGVLLHKIDTFFVSADGDAFAVLVQAPAAVYPRWQPLFNRIRNSIAAAVTATDPTPTDTSPSVATDPSADTSGGYAEPDFCSTHECIPNFDNGNGYIVQCADGEWSHSGGLQGACSYHGGETGNSEDGYGDSYSTPDTYDTPDGYSGGEIGPGDGYQVTCADGAISNSGGISGACSHHGGVGP
jgi:hypothetical protein